MISRTKRMGRILAIAGVLSVALVLSVTPTAFADDTITLTPATQTVEYGQGWYLQGTIPAYESCLSCQSGTMTFTSGSITRSFSSFTLYQGQFGFSDQNLLPQTDLGVGTHSISLSYSPSPGMVASTTTPVKVTITPAPVSENTTIITDPNNTANAIITGQLSGQFIDQLPDCYCEDSGLYGMPAGTWNLTVTDSKGAVVLSRQQQEAAGGHEYFVVYWPDVPAGESFSALSTFTVAAASSANFTMTDHKFAWTSAAATGSGKADTGSGSAKPTAPAASPGFQPPLWLLLLVLLVAILLAALVVILLVRRRTEPRAVTAARTNVGTDAGEPVQ